MPRVTLNQTNFTSGELSPKVYGRTDVARYQNAAKSLRNCIVGIHGGARRRPGSVFVAGTKDHAKRSRLVPFVSSVTQAYMLEFGHLYMRVYVQSGGQVLNGAVPYEIATPYTESMLSEIDYTQGADTMFLFHQGVMIHTLKRLAPDKWALQPAPITVFPFDEIGHRFNIALTLSDASVGVGRTINAPAPVFLDGDVERRITYLSGTARITGFTSATQVTVEVQAEFPVLAIPANDWVLEDSPQAACTPSAKDPVGTVITLDTAAVNCFRAEDAGKWVRINGGLVQITGFTSATNVSAKIKEELTAVVAAPASAWTLESSVWNTRDGYPRTGALYEQRLIAASTVKYPQTVWGSRTGLFFDFKGGTIDDDSFAFSLPSTGQINEIRKLAGSSVLIPLTYGGEYTMEGGIEKPLTPTNVRAKPRSTRGCNNVKPVQIDGETLFVQRAGKKVRALSYDTESAKYAVPDLTVLARHITKSGIVDMAYQQEGPEDEDSETDQEGSILWCVLKNGRLATLTIDREEGVLAWTPQDTDGAFESIATIPNATGDEVWVIVRRTINGQTRRYVERFEDGLYTDCAIRGTSAPGAAVWAGLGHLEAKDVAARADGVYMGPHTVEGAEITLSRDANDVEIGLPFTNEVTLLRPEVQTRDGTAQGNAQRVHEVSLLFMDTVGAKINGEEISFRQFGSDLLDQVPAEFSGIKSAGLTDWTRGDQEITITQDEPNPFHLLSVIRKFTVNS